MCGVCSTSILEEGSQGQVMLHPDLATPICSECLEQFNQVDWEWKLTTTKIPGKEGACRWCTKVGKMVNCNDCAKSFSKKCLKVNLGANYIKLAETGGSWICLVCDTRPLEKIRSFLWVDGESGLMKDRGNLREGLGTISEGSIANSATVSPSRVQSVRNYDNQNIRGGLGNKLPRPGGAHRHQRPVTPRGGMSFRYPGYRGGPPRVGTPPSGGRQNGQRVGTPFPLKQTTPRMLGHGNITIEKVAKQAPVPMAQPRNGQTAAIINQLQRYR